MPKTTKRAATRRASKVVRAHATQLPKLEVKAARQRAPGYKPPARGIARYPVLTTIVALLIIGLGIGTLYLAHLGPFALPAKKIVTHPHPTATVAPTPDPTLAPANSPCLKLVSKLTDTAPAPTGAAFTKIVHSYSAVPAMTIDTSKLYCAGINTNRGLIVLELDPQIAPQTVNNFVYLAEHQFYDGLKFHRVVPGFVIQSGDPLGNGTGGSGYKIPAETVFGNYTAGCIAMAKLSTETVNSGSQFFICTADDTQALQPKSYNLFGHVVQGLDIAKKIQGPGDDASTKNIVPDTILHVIVIPAS